MGSYIYGGQFAPLGNDIVDKLITFGLGHFMSDESVVEEIYRGQVGDLMLFAIGLNISEVATSQNILMIPTEHHAGAFPFS